MQTLEKKHYRSNFRRKVAQEVMAGLLTQQQAAEKYHISVNLVREWIRWYKRNYIEPHLTMKPKRSNSKETERIKQLEKQLKETQKALRESELKNKLLDEMINIAESEFDIPVRKKSGSRSSLEGHHKSKFT